MSHIYASGTLAADMHANVAAEATGSARARRLYERTDDPGMKDMWSFLIARDRSQGLSIDGRGEFSLRRAELLGEEPILSSPGAHSYTKPSRSSAAPASRRRPATPSGLSGWAAE